MATMQREILEQFRGFRPNKPGCAEEMIQVRYAETDRMGVVYHANYLVWFNVVRDKLVTEIGIDINEWEQKGIVSPVVEIQCFYRFPARFGDRLRVQCLGRARGTVASVFTYYRILNPKGGRLVAFGKSVNVLINRNGKRLIRCPEKLAQRIANLAQLD